MEDVIVLKVYRDKGDSVVHREGEELKMTRDRANELSGMGYVKIRPSIAKTETKVEKAKPTSKEEKVKPETKDEKHFQ